MENKYFEIFIKTCGSEKKAGEILKLTQQGISSIRCNRTNLDIDKARTISGYLKNKLDLDILPEKLISFIDKKRYEFSHSNLFYEIPIQFSPINLGLIKITTNKNYSQSHLEIIDDKLIIVDEFNYLISGEESYFYYLNLNKKIVEGCKINLQKLINNGLNKSIVAYISKEFDLIERTKLAQRVKNLASNRRGKPSKKNPNVQNSAHLELPKGVKTRNFVSKFFSLGNHNIYSQLKKIIEHNDAKLLEQVRQQKITPHAAYQSILNKKSEPSFSFRSLFNR